MIVACRPCPDRGQRHQMRKVQGMDQWLPDIGIDMAGQARQPGFDRVHAFADAGEPQSVDDPLDDADLFVRTYTIRSEEHTAELQSLMRTSDAVFCLKKKT